MMNKSQILYVFIVSLSVISFVIALRVYFQADNTDIKTKTRNLEFTDFLSKSSDNFGTLNKNAPEETIQFGQLAGKWDCTSWDLLPDSSWHESRAFWTFRYTLDGFAIEDVWTEKAEDSTNNTRALGRDFNGINMRIFNPELNSWQCVWLQNRTNSISPIWHAKYIENKSLVMQDSTKAWKIVFYNIRDNSFDWKYDVLTDSTWVTRSKIKGTRIK